MPRGAVEAELNVPCVRLLDLIQAITHGPRRDRGAAWRLLQRLRRRRQRRGSGTWLGDLVLRESDDAMKRAAMPDRKSVV